MKSFIRWKLFVSELNWSWSLVKDVWVVIPEVFFTLVLRNQSSVFDDWNLTPVKNDDLDKGESKQSSLKLSTIDDETMSSSESHQLIFFLSSLLQLHIEPLKDFEVAVRFLIHLNWSLIKAQLTLNCCHRYIEIIVFSLSVSNDNICSVS